MRPEFTYEFTPWEPLYMATEEEPDAGAMIKHCIGYWNGEQKANIPCTMTLREWKSPKRESLIKGIDHNAILLAEDICSGALDGR